MRLGRMAQKNAHKWFDDAVVAHRRLVYEAKNQGHNRVMNADWADQIA